MKKILSLVILPIVLFCGFSISLSAQAGNVLTLDEGSFRLEQTNALGGVNIALSVRTVRTVRASV